MVERKRFIHLALFAVAVVIAVIVLALVDEVALAVIAGLVGIVLIGAAVPYFAIEEDERPHPGARHEVRGARRH